MVGHEANWIPICHPMITNFYAFYKPSQQSKPNLELIYLVYRIFDSSSFMCVLVLIFLAWIL